MEDGKSKEAYKFRRLVLRPVSSKVSGWWNELLSRGSMELEALCLFPPRWVKVPYSRIMFDVVDLTHRGLWRVFILHCKVSNQSRHACQKVWGYFPGYLKPFCISLKNLYLTDYKWALLKKQQLGFFFKSAVFSIACLYLCKVTTLYYQEAKSSNLYYKDYYFWRLWGYVVVAELLAFFLIKILFFIFRVTLFIDRRKG